MTSISDFMVHYFLRNVVYLLNLSHINPDVGIGLSCPLRLSYVVYTSFAGQVEKKARLCFSSKASKNGRCTAEMISVSEIWIFVPVRSVSQSS